MANMHGLRAAMAAELLVTGVGVAAQREGAPAAALLPRRSVVATTLESVAASQPLERDGVHIPERGKSNQHQNTHGVKA